VLFRLVISAFALRMRSPIVSFVGMAALIERAVAFWCALCSNGLMVSLVVYAISRASANASWLLVSTDCFVAARSTKSWFPVIIMPLSYTARMDMPSSTDFMPSFDSTLASRSFTGSPLRTTSVSLLTHTLPSWIFVGSPTALSWLMTGPGGCPVLPSGTIMSVAARSPDFANVFTLPLSSRMANLNGFNVVNMKTFGPSRYSSSGASSVLFISAMANFTSVFFRTLKVTWPFMLFLSSCNCDARTFCRLAMPTSWQSFSTSTISSTSDVFCCNTCCDGMFIFLSYGLILTGSPMDVLINMNFMFLSPRFNFVSKTRRIACAFSTRSSSLICSVPNET